MTCCLNPTCHNPPHAPDVEVCSHCGVTLSVLRHYRPIKVLGSGGFGKTYLAEDIEKFNEYCVIKQFAPQSQGTGSLQKATELFEQEARRLQELGEHPQIPALLAYFEEEKRLYLIQQFIDGENLLEELQNQGMFTEQKIRDLLSEILNILTVVHENKVIHRDIKPQNLIRRRQDDKLFLIDFGASKQLTATVMTQPGTMIGSFGYAPPEQMQDGEVYPASDLYSLGATCFHLLSGVTPWSLWKTQGYGWVNNWRQYLQKPVTIELMAILDKLLQTDYQQRYKLAVDALADIKNLPPIQDTPQTVTFYRENLPEQESFPTATVQNPVSPMMAISPTVTNVKIADATAPASLLKTSSAKKTPLLVGAAILIVSFGGYGIWQASQSILSPSIAYEKLTLSNSLLGHSDYVSSLAISPDGKTLVSGGGDRIIKVWNLQTGGLQTTLTSHTDAINSLAITPDSESLMSGSKDGTIKIWNLKVPGLKSTFTGHQGSVNSLAVSPDGKSFVSGSSDKSVKLWDLASGTVKNTWNGHTQRVWRVLFSPDNQSIISSSDDKTVKVWDAKSPSPKINITGHSDLVYGLAVSPDSRTLVTGSLDKSIKIWNLPQGTLKNTLQWHKYGITCVAISPDGKTLASGSYDNTIKIWDLKTGELKNTLTGHNDLVYAVVFSPDGKTLVSSSRDKTIKVWR
ncbi:serine/threonine-protein kinase [Calothrix sp. 336/3]|uniref:serine/threonine-protein kinase n=1 Tax=Calothrix sp. 336/3 TaxID=1337936 RepID=UPI0004E31941|nr:serine/threonine-protein kinase [Calothrix sp. 336/3]AKG21166.1 serine/threonine protein kinase [Calothrix sp. 336/3]